MDAEMAKLVFEEYRALRGEILLCLERRITIISYGLTVIGVLAAAAVAGLRLDGDTGYLSSGLILAVALPIASIYILYTWLYETRRVRRASHYLWGMELWCQQELGWRVLQWEQTLRSKRPAWGHFHDHYRWTSAFFFAVALLSSQAGVECLHLGGLFQSPGLNGAIHILLGFGVLGWGATTFVYSHNLEETYNIEPCLEDYQRRSQGVLAAGAVRTGRGCGVAGPGGVTRTGVTGEVGNTGRLVSLGASSCETTAGWAT